jgi:hypothetical protein
VKWNPAAIRAHKSVTCEVLPGKMSAKHMFTGHFPPERVLQGRVAATA